MWFQRWTKGWRIVDSQGRVVAKYAVWPTPKLERAGDVEAVREWLVKECAKLLKERG